MLLALPYPWWLSRVTMTIYRRVSEATDASLAAGGPPRDLRDRCEPQQPPRQTDGEFAARPLAGGSGCSAPGYARQTAGGQTKPLRKAKHQTNQVNKATSLATRDLFEVISLQLRS